MEENKVSVLQNVALFDIKITLWTGRVKLYAEDLRRSGYGHLVEGLQNSEEVINLGSKRIYPQEELRPFNSHKYQAEKLLRECGFRSFSASVVPRDSVATIAEKLDRIRRQFYCDREELKLSYSERLQHWADQNPEWRNAILGSAPGAECIYNKLSFNYRYVLLESEHSIGTSGDEDVGLTMIDQLLGEVQEEANSVWLDVISGREHFPRRSVDRIVALQSKLQGFSFIDPRVPPMVDKLTNALDLIPPEGRIAGHAFQAIDAAVQTLCDVERNKSYGEAVLSQNATSADTTELLEEAQAMDDETRIEGPMTTSNPASDNTPEAGHQPAPAQETVPIEADDDNALDNVPKQQHEAPVTQALFNF